MLLKERFLYNSRYRGGMERRKEGWELWKQGRGRQERTEEGREGGTEGGRERGRIDGWMDV